MNRTVRTLTAVLATVAIPAVAIAQASPGEETTYLIRGGTVVNPGVARSPNTSILVRNNRIVQMGQNIAAGDAKVIDATGKLIYPGMVDSYTGIGLSEIGS